MRGFTKKSFRFTRAWYLLRRAIRLGLPAARVLAVQGRRAA